MKHSNSLFAISIQRCCCCMKKLNCYKRRERSCAARWRSLAPTSSAHNAQNADNARKNTAFPPVCKKCAKVCRAPKKRKSHEESYDSSWDFGALEGTRIPGPLIKRMSQLGNDRLHSFRFIWNHRCFYLHSCVSVSNYLQWIRHK